jgi:SAM-dependent methyltransferase
MMKGPVKKEEAPQLARNFAYRTAIARTKVSAPTKFLLREAHIQKLDDSRVLDFGCGKGYDADVYGFDKYDPAFFPDYPTGQYDYIICNYVLNVLTKEDEADILEQIDELLKPDGVAYISVRRDKCYKNGKLTSEGHFTRRGTYQRHVELKLESVKSMGGFQTYAMYKGDSEWATRDQDTETTQLGSSNQIPTEICQPN